MHLQHRRREWVSAVILLALVLLFPSVLWLITKDLRESGWFAITAWALASAGALTYPFWQRRRADAALDEQIAQEYRWYLAHPSRVSIEAAGWRHTCAYSNFEFSWASLHSYWDLPDVFVLTTRSQLSLIPKRVISPDELTELRRVAVSSLAGVESLAESVSFKLSLLEHADARRAHRRHTWPWLRRLVYLFGFALAFFFLFVVEPDVPGLDIVLTLIGCMCLLVTVSAEFVADAFHFWTATKPVVETISVTPQRLLWSIEHYGAHMGYPFDFFEKVAETRRTFMLYFGHEGEWLLIPKRVLTPKLIERFREWAAKLGPRN